MKHKQTVKQYNVHDVTKLVTHKMVQLQIAVSVIYFIALEVYSDYDNVNNNKKNTFSN